MDSENKTIRAFIGADIDEQCRQQISTLIKQLSRDIHGAKINWVSTKNLHITLRFLGDFPADNINALIDVIAMHTEKLRRFIVKLGNLDAFPHRHPHYFAIVIELNAELAMLSKAVNSAVNKFSLKPDKRPFFPHLTLGRIKRAHNLKFDYKAVRLPESININSFSLYQSSLEPSGAIYTPIKRFLLNPL